MSSSIVSNIGCIMYPKMRCRIFLFVSERIELKIRDVFPFYCLLKITLTKSSIEKKGILWLTLSGNNLSLKEVRARTQERIMETGTRENHCPHIGFFCDLCLSNFLV